MIVVFVATVAISLGTWLGAPTLAPILVGLAVGLVRPTHAARRAALAGLLSWGGVLAVAALRGDALGAFGSALGSAIGVPGSVIVLATLLYPTALASSAAWLAHLVSLRRFASFDPGAASGTTPPNT